MRQTAGAIGNDSIDSHHDEVFKLDRLIDESLKTGDISPILSAIQFLNNYSHDHFLQEEHIMKDYAPYLLDDHKHEHDLLNEMIHDLSLFSNTHPPYAHLALRTRRVVDRLIRHIRLKDSLMKGII